MHAGSTTRIRDASPATLRRRLVATLALAAAGWPMAARAERWIVLGRREVNLGADHDEIPVTSERGKFRAIKLRVRERGVQFAHMTVIFGNGRRFEVLLRDFIPAGGESRIVDLPGSDRTVNRVILRYTTRPGSAERAEVVLWGLQD